MIERYTIKFSPALSQKGWENALHEPGLANDAVLSSSYKMKARVEVSGDFADLKTLGDRNSSGGQSCCGSNEGAAA
jgi:hypothetical protein